jgi:hypothetical protein
MSKIITKYMNEEAHEDICRAYHVYHAMPYNERQLRKEKYQPEGMYPNGSRPATVKGLAGLCYMEDFISFEGDRVLNKTNIIYRTEFDDGTWYAGSSVNGIAYRISGEVGDAINKSKISSARIKLKYKEMFKTGIKCVVTISEHFSKPFETRRELRLIENNYIDLSDPKCLNSIMATKV